MEWIDTKERLPPIGHKSVQGSAWVLGVIVDGHENQIVAEVRYVATPKNPFWKDAFENRVYVSHWMELPQPPIFYADDEPDRECYYCGQESCDCDML